MAEDKKLEQRIVNTCSGRYNGNLAAVLIFGSYNTGSFVNGKSDMDLIILFKEKIKFSHRERDELFHKEFSDIPASIIHFRTLDDYREHIYEEGSWSSWITVISGSKRIYSTEEFERFREDLEKNPIPNRSLLEYLIHKDKIELDGYFKKNKGWDLTKSFFSHIRRKLQMLNYLDGNELAFDYQICLSNLRNVSYWDDLKELGERYENREETNEEERQKYYQLSKELTKILEQKLK